MMRRVITAAVVLCSAAVAAQPAIRTQDVVDRVANHAREVWDNAPTTRLGATTPLGHASLLFRKALSNSTFMHAATKLYDGVTGPNLYQMARAGKWRELPAALHSRGRLLTAQTKLFARTVWHSPRRALQLNMDDLQTDVSGQLEELRSAFCADQSSLVTQLKDFVPSSFKELLPPDETLNSAVNCFCNFDLTDPAYQTAVTMVTDSVDETPEEIYDAVTGVIVALMSSKGLCQGDCQKAMESVMVFAMDMGLEEFEKQLVSALDAPPPSSPPPADAHAKQVATSTPKCFCNIDYAGIFASLKSAGTTFVGQVETFVADVTTAKIPPFVKDVKAFLVAVIGDDGFLGNKGTCKGDCQDLGKAAIKMQLTHLLSFDFDAIVKAVENADSPTDLLPEVDVEDLVDVDVEDLVGRRLGSTAERTLPARAAHAAAVLRKRGLKAAGGEGEGGLVLLRGRRLAFSDYESTINAIGDSSVACMCLYLDKEKMLDVLDQIDAAFVDSIEAMTADEAWDDPDIAYNFAVEMTDLAKAAFDDWFMSNYGMCGGVSDGCVKAQSSMFELVGLVEAHALQGGILTYSKVLAQAPDPPLSDFLKTIPLCYCSQAVNYGKLMEEVMLGMIFNDRNDLPKNYTLPWCTPGVSIEECYESGVYPTAVVSGVMTVSDMCLATECKEMLAAGFNTFLGITTHSKDTSTDAHTKCTSDEVAKCIPDASVTSCPAAPAQAAWLGDTIEGTGMGDDDWKVAYWTACAFSQICPPPDVSAYTVSSTITVVATQVDTPAKRASLKTKFRDAVNKKAGYLAITTANVKLYVDGELKVDARRRLQSHRRLQTNAEVKLEVETTSEQAKNAAQTYFEEADTAAIEADLQVDVVGETAFSAPETTSLVYSPPPPAPGYKDNLTGGGSGGCDQTCIIAVVCGTLGGLCCCGVLLAGVYMMMNGNKNKGKSAAAQGWSAGGGGNRGSSSKGDRTSTKQGGETRQKSTAADRDSNAPGYGDNF